MFSLTEIIYRFLKQSMELVYYHIQYIKDPEEFKRKMNNTGWTFDFKNVSTKK